IVNVVVVDSFWLLKSIEPVRSAVGTMATVDVTPILRMLRRTVVSAMCAWPVMAPVSRSMTVFTDDFGIWAVTLGLARNVVPVTLLNGTLMVLSALAGAAAISAPPTVSVTVAAPATRIRRR